METGNYKFSNVSSGIANSAQRGIANSAQRGWLLNSTLRNSGLSFDSLELMLNMTELMQI